jgi:MFS transporter, MHS family, proline/betaine transporter
MTQPLDHAAYRRLVVAGTAGNVMEWYDFALYGYFAQVIGQEFFPSDDPLTSVIGAFGAFAAGFLMRPLGGLAFGYVADKFGRKRALVLSVAAMALPTFAIGLLPGYATLGAAAPVLLVLLRMVQGLSVGGEYTTSVVFLIEHAPPHRRGLAGSWAVFGATGGILLGSFAGTLTNWALTPDEVRAWGWRVPMMLGLLVGLVGLWVRRGIPETGSVAPAGRNPLAAAFRDHWRTILLIACFNALNAVGFYLIFVYVVTYLEEFDHLSPGRALDVNTASMVLLAVLVPTSGWLSDRVGRRPILLASAGGVLVLALPLFGLLHHPDLAAILVGELGFVLLLGLYLGTVPSAMYHILPEGARASTLSVGYNLCLGVIGGTTPMVASLLIRVSGDDLSPAYYLMGAAAVTLATVLITRSPTTER